MGRYKMVMLSTEKATNYYLVDTEPTIGIGDRIMCVAEDDYGYIQSAPVFAGQLNHSKLKRYVKIVASTDISLGLYTIHTKAIQKFIDNPLLEIDDVIFNDEIVIIWKEEEKSPKVDYELLKNFNLWLQTSFCQTFPILHKEVDNLCLFLTQNEEYQKNVKY